MPGARTDAAPVDDRGEKGRDTMAARGRMKQDKKRMKEADGRGRESQRNSVCWLTFSNVDRDALLRAELIFQEQIRMTRTRY